MKHRQLKNKNVMKWFTIDEHNTMQSYIRSHEFVFLNFLIMILVMENKTSKWILRNSSSNDFPVIDDGMSSIKSFVEKHLITFIV